MKRSIIQLVLFSLLLATCFNACKSKDVSPPEPVDTKDVNKLSQVLVFSSNTTTSSGSLPTASTSPTSYITNSPSLSVSTTGGTVYIPVAYSGSSQIAFAYIQVQGANLYFKIPIPNAGSSGQFAIPITLPATLQGAFVLLMQLVDASGNIVVSKTINIPVTTTVPLACGNGYVQGNAGITLTEHALNGKNGNLTIDYDTYTAPDRIDVFVDGKWVSGTGNAITPPPPLSNCSNPQAGFVGKYGTFSIPVTSNNKIIQVYVSGCLGGSTAWEYEVTCP